MKNKKDIKLRIMDWWEPDTKENFYNNFLVKMLQDKFNVIYSDTPDFIIYGPFGYNHLKYDCVRIFLTGENVRTNFNIADYGIDFDFMEFGDRHFRSCLYNALRHDLNTIAQKHLIEPKAIKPRSGFCGFVVSASYPPYTDIREECFKKLSKYKQVDSGGRYNNNIGYQVTDKIEWLKNYKFNLCFENASYPGYLTEKLFDAFAAGCIPIYWGDTSLRAVDEAFTKDIKCIENFINADGGGVLKNTNMNTAKATQIDMRIPCIKRHLMTYRINPKAFINAHNFPDLDSLVEEVKRIDNDKEAYIAMLKEPVFLPLKSENMDDGLKEIKEYKEKFKAFLESIFMQEPQSAFRRGDGKILELYTEDQKRMAGVEDMEKYKIAIQQTKGLGTLLHYRKIALFLNNFLYVATFRYAKKKFKEFFKKPPAKNA